MNSIDMVWIFSMKLILKLAFQTQPSTLTTIDTFYSMLQQQSGFAVTCWNYLVLVCLIVIISSCILLNEMNEWFLNHVRWALLFVVDACRSDLFQVFLSFQEKEWSNLTFAISHVLIYVFCCYSIISMNLYG